jgi:hypothetical protein
MWKQKLTFVGFLGDSDGFYHAGREEQGFSIQTQPMFEDEVNNNSPVNSSSSSPIISQYFTIKEENKGEISWINDPLGDIPESYKSTTLNRTTYNSSTTALEDTERSNSDLLSRSHKVLRGTAGGKEELDPGMNISSISF